MEDPRAERAAKNESLFRELNERIEEVGSRFQAGELRLVCECSDSACTRTIAMTTAEYERVRARGDRFAVVAGHDDPAVERIVEETERFVVVEKIGPGADLARRLDPRA